MDALIESLRAAGRPLLAALLERDGHRPVSELSAALHRFTPAVPLEPALRAAFADELGRCRAPAPEAVLQSLERRRVLQTGPHVTVSEGPTFFALHLAATAGLATDEPYVVGAFSGVPFASSAWPGCLNYSDRFALEDLFTDEGPGDPLLAALRRDERNRALDNPASSERRVALVESAQRDALVYAAEIPDRLRKLVPRFQKALADLAPAIEDEDQDFTRFALGFAERTLGRLLERQVCYFDLNRVIAGYLLRALPERGHPLAELLLRPTLRESVLPALGPGPLFYAESVQSGRPQMVGLHATGHALEGKSVRIPLEPTPLTAALAERRLCPGLGLTFVSLAFVNGFRCLGSFDQLEYLGRFKSALASLGWPPPIAALLDDPGGLTTGRALGEDGRPIHPLDVVLGAALRFEPESPLREWIEPLLPRLLQR